MEKDPKGGGRTRKWIVVDVGIVFGREQRRQLLKPLFKGEIVECTGVQVGRIMHQI